MTVNRFTEHPNSVGESYWQHLRAALGYSARMLTAAACCALHGLCPWLCGTTGSDAICALHDEMQARRALANGEYPSAAPSSALRHAKSSASQ